MHTTMKFTRSLIILLTMVLVASCDNEYLDPFATLEPDVVSSEENLINLINGLQRRVSTDRTSPIYTVATTTGLNTAELRLLNPGNLGENEILLGGNEVSGDNEVLSNMWSQLMLTRKEATLAIDNASVASSTARANTIKAYGLFYRALAHGTLIQYFEQVPLTIGKNSKFNDRSTVLNSVIADLNEAVSLASSGDNSISFTSTFDISDVSHAMLARYQLMSGDFDGAISNAAKASITNTSNVWTYDAAFPNPLAFWFSSNNVHQAKDQNFGLSGALVPNSADERIAFHTSVDPKDTTNTNFVVKGFYQSKTTSIPVYLPGEMLLIQAEAHARQNEITEAISFLDKVLTKTSATDAFGLGANLAAYAGANDQNSVLVEIYRNRRIELYLVGLALEDTKRFNRPDSDFNRVYYPYPNDERDNNSNTPKNPSS